MNTSDNKPNSTGEPAPVGVNALRHKAEEKFRVLENLRPKSLQIKGNERLVSELRVYQIELEIQNEELRKTQAELEASQASFMDLYDFAPVGYMTVSQAGMIHQANLTASTLLGTAREVLAGQPITRFILKDDQDIFYNHRKQLFETNSPQVFELQLLRTDHPPFWARLEATIAQDDEFVQPSCRVIVSDISEWKRLEAEKEELEARYRQRQKAESLGRMAGAIAHNYNNLLGAIMGNLELAMEDQLPGSVIGGNLTEAMQAARRAAEVNCLILTYLGQAPATFEPLDLSETCRRGLSTLETAVPKNIDLEVDFPASGPTIEANAHQIQQILTNLVTNSWEAFGQDRGTIHLAVKTVFPGDIAVKRRFPLDWQPRGQLYACLEVTDLGCGIPEIDIENLFAPFFSSKLTGRGLGLPVVLGIVRAHGGVITVESEVSRGSIVRVFLPVSAQKVLFRQEVAAGLTEFKGDGTIMIVDDEPMILLLAGNILTRLGFTVLEAKDGVEAVEMFRRHRNNIRCVLCDVFMPHMDGWETLAALRHIVPGIPVIFSSGTDEAQVMAGDHPELPQVFLGKPYGPARLREALSRVL